MDDKEPKITYDIPFASDEESSIKKQIIAEELVILFATNRIHLLNEKLFIMYQSKLMMERMDNIDEHLSNPEEFVSEQVTNTPSRKRKLESGPNSTAPGELVVRTPPNVIDLSWYLGYGFLLMKQVKKL